MREEKNLFFSFPGKLTGARGGFTLLELAIVVTILGIIIALAAPRLVHLVPETELRASSRRLASTIMYARDQAATSGKVHRLSFNQKEGVYWIDWETEKDEFVPRTTEIFSQGRLKEGVEIREISLAGEIQDSEVVNIDFSPRGWIEEARIVLGDKRERTYSVVTEGYRGNVRVEAGENE